MRCPTRGSDNAAGWDLYSTQQKEILSGGHSLITIDISITVPWGTYAQIAPRSGLAVKNMITTGAGVINADYRGEGKVLLFNHGKQPFLIKNGDWIAQLILEKYKKTEIEETEDLNKTTRGTKGFGSSRIRSIDEEETLDTKIRKNYKDYKINTDIWGQMTKRGDEWWKDEEGVLFFNEKMLVPHIKDLRERVISQHHDTPITSHTEINGTIWQISRNYWWLTIQKDVQTYVQGCEVCQRTKTQTQAKAAPLIPHKIPDTNWQHISTDLIGPLPESKGYNVISVIVDKKSKQAYFIKTNMELSSLGQATIFQDEVFKHHRLPEKVISDQGPQYVSKFMIDLYRLLGITGNPSTVFYPQTDGQMEW
jgi:deoxyuridine 5'-triphosphate nucleotidohydrolase